MAVSPPPRVGAHRSHVRRKQLFEIGQLFLGFAIRSQRSVGSREGLTDDDVALEVFAPSNPDRVAGACCRNSGTDCRIAEFIGRLHTQRIGDCGLTPCVALR
jgi:hypothetical protein